VRERGSEGVRERGKNIFPHLSLPRSPAPPLPRSPALPLPRSPTPLDEFFLKRLPGVRRLWMSRILTVKFRNDNQQTKFRVTDGTEVHCFKPERV